MACGMQSGVDVFKQNPALASLPRHAFKREFMTFMSCLPDVSEATVNYLQSITLEVLGDPSNQATSSRSGKLLDTPVPV
jgi:hypothetical protein